MRTTVTLDPDVKSLLRKEVRRRGDPFKEVLNDAIRAGLKSSTNRRSEDFTPLVFDMLEPRVDLTRASALAASLEDEEINRGGQVRPRSSAAAHARRNSR